MKNQINIFTKVKNSPYWNGGFEGYASNQWDIKYYGFESEYEVEYAQLWAFGENFEMLQIATGVKAEFFIEGRSSGWLCTNTELTVKQLQKITEYVKECLKGLPEVLKEYREMEGA